MASDTGDRAAGWLQGWESSGIHRTGTAGDAAGAAWLAREAAALGADVSVEEFMLDRIDPVAVYLEFDGTRLDGVPVFDAPTTDMDGVVGELGVAGSKAMIGVAELSPHAVYSGEYRALRSSAAHAGMVIVCAGANPGLALLNAEQFRHPYGAPALHVRSETRDAVMSAASRGVRARLVAHSRRVTARADNVVVSIAGRDRTLAPLVVMTPRSSWWQSTAERGGGLVCWLESLRRVLAARPDRDVILTANSGHELGHIGLDDFIARRPGWDQPGGAVWIHYGANIGAAGGKLSLMSPDDGLRAQCVQHLIDAGQPLDVLVPKTHVPSGETRDIHRAGGCYITLVGSNAWFHLPQDRLPHSVDIPAIARIAAGAADLVAARMR
ncbi:MAG TPA: hypothetical protein VGG99_07050 [Acetobacteraceae bacterium]|jgi:hypothetical protein